MPLDHPDSRQAAHLFGWNGSGMEAIHSWQNALFSLDFKIAVARGLIPGLSYVHKFGSNDSVGTSLAPVCQGGFYRMPPPSSGVELAVISTSASDTAAGVGARSVFADYLNSSFVKVESTIATNGTSESTEIFTDVVRLRRYYASGAGQYANQSTPSQVGELTLQVSGGGDAWATIPTIDTNFGAGQSLIGAYTTAENETAYILSFTLSTDATKNVDFFFFKREGADIESAPFSTFRVQNLYNGATGITELEHLTFEEFPEKTDFGFFAISDQTSACSVEFELLVVDESIV